MDREAAKDAGQLVASGQLTLFDEPPPVGAGPARLLLLGGEPVEFRFERRRRRTIGIRIDDDGLFVAAPLRAPWREIEGFLREKARWILAKLAERAARGRPRALFGETGEWLLLFGREVMLQVDSGRRAVSLEPECLRVRVPEPHRRGVVRALLKGWLKEQALVALEPRVAHYAARVSLPAPPLKLSNARTQWGVCTSTGRIRLAWRLVHLAPELADYVVAHEVAHLIELNHSARFWALVEWLYPDWQDARARIERDAASLPKL